METLKDYLGFDFSDSWQLISANRDFKIASYLAPARDCNVEEIFAEIPIPHCTVFVVLHPIFTVSGLTSTHLNSSGRIPAYGLLNLLGKRLTTAEYTYGVAHKL